MLTYRRRLSNEELLNIARIVRQDPKDWTHGYFRL